MNNNLLTLKPDIRQQRCGLLNKEETDQYILLQSNFHTANVTLSICSDPVPMRDAQLCIGPDLHAGVDVYVGMILLQHCMSPKGALLATSGCLCSSCCGLGGIGEGGCADSDQRQVREEVSAIGCHDRPLIRDTVLVGIGRCSRVVGVASGVACL